MTASPNIVSVVFSAPSAFILAVQPAYGSSGSVSSITNSLFAPVFLSMVSRISSRFSSGNFFKLIFLYSILRILLLLGMFRVVNVTLVDSVLIARKQ